MKKIISLLLSAAMLFCLCACGAEKEEESAKEAPTGMESTLPGASLSAPEEENEDYNTALKFVGKSLDELVAEIGEPLAAEYSPSCLGDGEDGNLEYEGFSVVTYREGGSETVKDVIK